MFSRDIAKIENKVFKILNIYDGEKMIECNEENEYRYVQIKR